MNIEEPAGNGLVGEASADVTALIPVNPDAYTEFADGAWKVVSLEETPDAELPESWPGPFSAAGRPSSRAR
ncbi:hypothetical protein [Arthrobacter antioxidans]|uniref:hypothetical protein n=1 Tax=Arthrobacter antioxidans TaxID=2895818 RepID=UPI001FFEAEB5|nr:hypothetical protein [Arthrobacter antioxidans]